MLKYLKHFAEQIGTQFGAFGEVLVEDLTRCHIESFADYNLAIFSVAFGEIFSQNLTKCPKIRPIFFLKWLKKQSRYTINIISITLLLITFTALFTKNINIKCLTKTINANF